MATQLSLPEFETPTQYFDPIQATFTGGAEEPFCRWFPYLEGYSPEFVKSILRYFAPDAKVILDPFGGTATTAFVASEKGLVSYICEVNPVMQFLFDVKTTIRLMNLGARMKLCAELLQIRDDFSNRIKGVNPDGDLSDTYSKAFGNSKFFEDETLDLILRARALIDNINTCAPITGQLLAVAILASLIPCSLLKRAGDVRYKTEEELTKGIPDFLATVTLKLTAIIQDIYSSNGEFKARPLLICDNAKHLDSIPSLGVEALITSPPYINGTNYFRNTKLELWFLRCLGTKDDLGIYRRKTVTAGINDVTVDKSSLPHLPSVEAIVNQLSEKPYDQRIPLMVASYFAEISQVFSGIRKHLKSNAMVAIDIGDSNYGGIHIPADRLIIESLSDHGYSLRKKIELRKRRSKNGASLKQALFVFYFKGEVDSAIAHPTAEPLWSQLWQEFKQTLPHQKHPYSKRNWGNPLHSLCSYQGKLKPSIAHHLVHTFVPANGIVLDTFSGVGTIPFEAALHGKRAYAFDLSHAAFVISTAKLKVKSAEKAPEIIAALQDFIESYSITPDEKKEAESFGFNGKLVDYYHPETLREVFGARQFFKSQPEGDSSVALVKAACLHILHGNRPYALSRRSHPITPYSPSGEFEYRPLIPRLREKIRSCLASEVPDDFVEGTVYLQDATAYWPLEVNNLDAVITSPPFFDSTRFYLANWLRLWFMLWSADDFKSSPLSFIDERQKETFDVYEPIIRQAKERLRSNGVLVFHLGKSKKCDMASALIKVGRKWFSQWDVFDESVAHCESHGIRDKGTVTEHQYLVFY